MGKNPDWRVWRNVKVVHAWQACALSLNIDPDSMQPASDGWMDRENAPHFGRDNFPDALTHGEFENRIRLLLQWISDPVYFTQSPSKGYTPRNAEIRLSEFAQWLLNAVSGFDDRSGQLAEIAASHHITSPPPSQQAEWKQKVRALAETWMHEQIAATGKTPTVQEIAQHCEDEASQQNIRTSSGIFPTAETIKREVLTGITARKPGNRK